MTFPKWCMAGLMMSAGAVMACGENFATTPTPVRPPIQKLVDDARSGETVVIPPGVYHETLVVEGAQHSNITLIGYGVVLDGSELPIPREDIDIFSFTGVGILIRPGGSSPVTGVSVEGFIVENFDLGIYAGAEGTKIRNVELRNNTRGFRSTGVWLWSGPLEDSFVHDNGSHGVMASGGTIGANRIHGNGRNDTMGAGILVGGPTGTIRSVEVLRNDLHANRWGIFLREAGGSITRANQVHGSDRAGIMLAGFRSAGNLIENNDATGNGVRNVAPTFGFDLFDEHPNNAFPANIWRNNQGRANFE